MKQTLLNSCLLLCLLLFGTAHFSYAQQEAPTRLLQVYWDDDYINFYGKGTDRAYTDGNKFTLFYTKKKPSRFLVDRILPKAGNGSTNVFGWGLVELMFTPSDISNPKFQPDDYPWSGALYATHSLYSYNEKKKYDLQTEVDLGITGPASMAGQVQEGVHRFIHYQRPMGWDNQFGNSLLVNVNFTAEKELLHLRKFFEWIGGGQVMTGIGANAAAAYSLIRIGKMNPYFQGLMRQYGRSGSKNKVQFYFVFKSRVEWLLSSAVLEGGVNSTRPARPTQKPGGTSGSGENYHPLNPFVADYAYGPVLAINRFSISSIQTTTTAWMKGLYSHTWGNFTLTYAW